MADYQRWQDALKVWAQNATGLVFVWEDERRPHLMANQPYGILSGPSSVRVQGRDWLTHTPGPGTELFPEVRAPRAVTYGVRVVSRDQRADNKAGRYLELARMALRLPVPRALLSVAGMGLATVSEIRQFPGDTTFDDRVESVASMDLTFNVVATDGGVSDQDAGRIDTVGLTSEIQAGLQPPETPPNIEDETVG